MSNAVTIEELRKKAEELKNCLHLSYYPIGIKFAKSEEEIPTNAIRPFRDHNEKWAVCQLVQKARREDATYAMKVEDHWCWYPLITYGHFKLEKGAPDYEIALKNLGIPDREREEKFLEKVPVLEHNSNHATLIGSLKTIEFIPDVILIYADNPQMLRLMVGAIKYMDGDLLDTALDYVNSCCWSVLPTHFSRKFRVTIPDPGEVERAEMGDNEIILSAPVERFGELVDTTLLKDSRYKLRSGTRTGLVPYFARAEFMHKLYEIWGLKHDGAVSWTEKERGY